MSHQQLALVLIIAFITMYSMTTFRLSLRSSSRLRSIPQAS